MRFPGTNFKLLMTGFSLKETVITFGVLIAGITITFFSSSYSRLNIENAARQDFENSCNEITMRIQTRLDEHAQLLRSGEALISVSDTVTRKEWHEYYLRTRIDTFLPGIQGFGYVTLIKKEDLQNHLKIIRQEGFPDYNVTPEGDREYYTSILYIEPFTGTNLRAFGYDMYSEPVRRKAMALARDLNMPMLSGKVRLVQETGEDLQSGVLMYIPVYQKNMPVTNINERRKAIIGWVYSPYRMNDLMSGILGHDNQIPVALMIYDDELVTHDNLMYDSGSSTDGKKPNLYLEKRISFNSKIWTLAFSARKQELSFFDKSQIIMWLTGLIITILLFILSLMQIRSNIRTRQIEQLNLQLAKLNTDKDRFISILSHDLKSPFTSILGFLELLISDIRRYTIEDIEKHLITVNEAARNTFNLLEDLLMWTWAHSGKIPFKRNNHKFSEIYESVVDLLKPMADSKKITMEFKDPENLVLFADIDMMKAVLRNLVSNAIKFTRKGGKIEITGKRVDNRHVITITDNGVGIEPDRLIRLFDMTTIRSTSGTDGEKGSGLGLILCREFIEKHNGKLAVSSEPGKGSKFTFTLPIG